MKLSEKALELIARVEKKQAEAAAQKAGTPADPQLSLFARGIGAPGVTAVLRVKDVCKLLNVCPQHVADLIDEGRLEAVDVSRSLRKRHNFRISGDAVARFVAASTHSETHVPEAGPNGLRRGRRVARA
jgi:excisionase family DNA binding protein